MVKPHAKCVLVFALASLLFAVGGLAGGAASRSATGKQRVDTRLVFDRNQLCKWEDCGKGEIAIMNLDGSGFRRLLAHNGITEEVPSWSPRKDRIAFAMGKGTDQGIWVMNTNGHSQRRLRTPRAIVATEPDWSPTGRSIVFRASTYDGHALWTVNVRTGKLSQLTSGLFTDTGPQWSPDGKRIAFSRNGKVWTMRMRDHRLRRLTVWEGYQPVWSPDGRRIAYAGKLGLSLMNADGTQKHRVGVSGIGVFTWSADGKWIVFTGGNEGAGLFAIHPDGSGRHMIRHEPGGPNGWYAGSPDG
jgi:Tol biopolymer transport system component